MSAIRRSLRILALSVVPLAVGGVVLALSVDLDTGRRKRPHLSPVEAGAHATPSVPRAPALKFPPAGVVEIRGPTASPVVLAASRDAGRDLEIACATCHTTRAPDPSTRASADLDLFHQGLSLAHGGMACASCHAPPAYDGLRLADGTRVPYVDVMRLCGQCHGPQMRDYQHGAHGGMSGHWDMSRGGRIRNACVICHDPHAPAYPKLQPARGPNDRFPPASHADRGEETPPRTPPAAGAEGHGHPAAREREYEQERHR